ncbi:GAP family protein [Mycobacterium sp. 1274756.6]|uniref:GAP family protein n=1 Tax=Mycobacterium sp. 1274756.6 TaxID=1834076 RepID=UPI0009ED767F|nr:GAP family protein [Mycobacterium sp. 1274756.6]
MWAVVLGVAAAGALNPVALGLVLLLLSRSRPVYSLLAYWAGAMTTNLPVMVVPLLLLDWWPAFSDLVDKLSSATGSIGRYIQISLGVIALAIAALIMLRALRQPAAVGEAPTGAAVSGGGEGDEPNGLSQHIPLIATLARKENSKVQRIVHRIYKVWESDALWIAFVLGMITLIGPEVVLFVDTAIVVSGEPIGVQVTGAIVFVLVAFSLFEVALVAYLVAPNKSRAVVRPIHDWTRRYRRRIFVLILLIAGVWQLAMGTGVI